MAEQKLLDDFKNNPADRWKFIADTVMGGISSGQLSFTLNENANFARMIGKVSTENNGGFIQFRRSIICKVPMFQKLQSFDVNVILIHQQFHQIVYLHLILVRVIAILLQLL